MEWESIQILSERTVGDQRTFQLAPAPSERWLAALERTLRRWQGEVGRLPVGVAIHRQGCDELVVNGVEEGNSANVDRLAAELVRTVSRDCEREERSRK